MIQVQFSRPLLTDYYSVVVEESAVPNVWRSIGMIQIMINLWQPKVKPSITQCLKLHFFDHNEEKKTLYVTNASNMSKGQSQKSQS